MMSCQAPFIEAPNYVSLQMNKCHLSVEYHKTTAKIVPVSPIVCSSVQELLSRLVPSQWGFVHLFDLCLWFGHVDTALALALNGVVGCKLEEHHLGALTDVSDAPPTWIHWHGCGCEGWETCSRCCWGFPVDNGVWMRDWDGDLKTAKEHARKVAKTPLVSGILQSFCRDEVLPFTMSDEAAARLLDIAILCGNFKAAANLAKTFSVRPLRRWMGGELLPRDRLPMLSAALLAGADFQDLHVKYSTDGDEVPLLRWAALRLGSEDWQQLGPFFESKLPWPSCDMEVGCWFLDFFSEEIHEDGNYLWISTDIVLNALRSGWDLKYIWDECCEEITGVVDDAGLLDLAILGGNSDCADVLATAGVELRRTCLKLFKRICRGERVELEKWDSGSGYPLDWVGLGLASECQSAATVAAYASLRRSFSREGAEKGVAVCQVLTNRFRVPMALVHDILAFSMEAPKILDQLDLWDEVRGWMPFLEVKAGGDDEAFQKDVQVEEGPTSDVWKNLVHLDFAKNW